MKIKIKRIDKLIPLPKYQTKGSVCFDILTRIEIKIKPGEIKAIPGNIIIKVPSGYMLMIVPRSSTPQKYGILSPHGVGILDQDYCGPGDELIIQVLNFSKKQVLIKRAERIAQAVFVKIAKAKFQEIVQIKGKSRGGLGSTG